MSVDAPQAGYLILDDTYYPGWSATVNGRPATIHPANVAFRAVAVPAGHDLVSFHFDPLSVKAGAIISLAALAVLIGGLMVPELRRRAARTQDGARGSRSPA